MRSECSDGERREPYRLALSRSAVAIACLTVIACCSACGFRSLKRDIEQAGHQVVVEGTIAARDGGQGPLVVVSYSVAAGEVVDLFVTPRSGRYLFVLPAGRYRVAAFQDRNRDLVYQPADEPAVLFDAPGDLVLQPGDRRGGVDLVVEASTTTPLPFAVNAASEQRLINQLPNPQLGTVVDMGDPRFSPEKGELGLWDPIRFLFEVGAGVYFLEEYDPQKIPVLFVHGAIGTPGDWKYLTSQLDRSRFQPWLAYYPTAPHLDRIGQMLVRTLAALQVKYGYSKLVLVAHSMGGLVTRAALNEAAKGNVSTRLVRIPAFVSLSSPWGGHVAAGTAVAHSPVVAPSWVDMAPGSEFLAGLPTVALPAECEYTLLFSYKGGSALVGGSNDGSVTVASELSMPIQRQAVRVLGFNESHTGILESSEVAAELNAILARASR